ncbi:MAG: CPBP family intramembrane metalloprotease, partial [bacterium]|nr:CPBP family intramembrane metalloprotease [bacterium]
PYTATFPSTLLLLMAVTIIPLVEEVGFRGLPLWLSKWPRIKNFMEKSPWNLWIVILGLNLYFGKWHSNYPVEWRVATFIFGVSWSWLAFRYRTIWPTIRLHYRWNIMLATIEFFSSPYVALELYKMVVFK